LDAHIQWSQLGDFPSFNDCLNPILWIHLVLSVLLHTCNASGTSLPRLNFLTLMNLLDKCNLKFLFALISKLSWDCILAIKLFPSREWRFL
jgi:hypothetical protein